MYEGYPLNSCVSRSKYHWINHYHWMVGKIRVPEPESCWYRLAGSKDIKLVYGDTSIEICAFLKHDLETLYWFAWRKLERLHGIDILWVKYSNLYIVFVG